MTNRLRAAFAATRRLRKTDEAGQGLAEYALILALIAVLCIGALGALGGAISGSSGFTVLPGVL